MVFTCCNCNCKFCTLSLRVLKGCECLIPPVICHSCINSKTPHLKCQWCDRSVPRKTLDGSSPIQIPTDMGPFLEWHRTQTDIRNIQNPNSMQLKLVPTIKKVKTNFNKFLGVRSLQKPFFRAAQHSAIRKGFPVSSYLVPVRVAFPKINRNITSYQWNKFQFLTLTSTVVPRLFASFTTYQQKKILPKAILLILKRVFEKEGSEYFVSDFLRNL